MDITRRTAIAATSMAVASAALNLKTASASASTQKSASFSFPKDFRWGAATAGHQVEGNNTNSDIWLLEHVKPTIYAESSGDACDSFNRWSEDLDLVKSIGLNSYRFSLEWARIEPAEGEFSTVMLDHYLHIIEGCRARGLTPIVTFNHYTAPRWFASKGGWEVTGSETYFARYCARAAQHLAKDIGYATTLNEPNILRLLKWLVLPFPPGMKQTEADMLAAAAKASGGVRFSTGNSGDADAMLPNLIAGHKAGMAAIKDVRPDLPVGVSLAITDDQAVGKNSKRDQKRADVYGAWLEAAKTSDFIGVQNYGRQLVGANGAVAPPKGSELTQMGEEFYPFSLEGAIRYAHTATGRPVLITENGIATTDDSRRAAYIPQVLAGVARALSDGVPVLGYVHWSLMDNFEWLFGYGPRYGLVAVDRTTQVRTVKPSAQVLGAIAQANRI